MPNKVPQWLKQLPPNEQQHAIDALEQMAVRGTRARAERYAATRIAYLYDYSNNLAQTADKLSGALNEFKTKSASLKSQLKLANDRVEGWRDTANRVSSQCDSLQQEVELLRRKLDAVRLIVK